MSQNFAKFWKPTFVATCPWEAKLKLIKRKTWTEVNTSPPALGSSGCRDVINLLTDEFFQLLCIVFQGHYPNGLLLQTLNMSDFPAKLSCPLTVSL
jgi:hypothetical protein